MPFWSNKIEHAKSLLGLRSRFDEDELPKGKRVKSNNPLYAGASGRSQMQIGNASQAVLHYRSWTYIAVACIARGCSQHFPIIVRKKAISQATKPQRFSVEHRHFERKCARLKKSLSSKVRKSQQGITEEFDFLEDDDALPRLLHRPNPVDTWVTFAQRFWIYVELTGTGYIYKHRDDSGQVVELWVVPTQWVKEIPDLFNETEGLVLRYMLLPFASWNSGQASDSWIEPEDMIAYKVVDPRGYNNGYSTVVAGSQIIDTMEAVEAARLSAIKNGSNIGNAITLDTDDEDIITRFEQRFLAKFSGEKKFAAPLILSKNAKFVANQAAQELAMSAAADQTRKYVLALYGLTESVVGFLEDVSLAAYRTALVQHAEIVINPRLSHLGQVLTERLAPEFGEGLEIYWEDTAPEDRDSKRQDMQLLVGAGVATPNILYTFAGEEPTDEPWGDMTLMQLGHGAGPQDPSDNGSNGEPSNPMIERPPDFAEQLQRLQTIQGLVGEAKSIRSLYIKQQRDYKRDSDGEFASTGGAGGSHSQSQADASHNEIHEERKNLARRVISHVKHLGSKALNNKLARALLKVEHKLAIVAHKTRDIAAAAAKKRGFNEEQTKRLKRVLSYADLAGSWASGAGTLALTGSAKAAKAVSLTLPTASALYLAYSTARNPAATWAAARDAIRGVANETHKSIDLIQKQAAKWDESKHPRAADGEFGHGSGSGAAKKPKEKKPKEKKPSQSDEDDEGEFEKLPAKRGEMLEAALVVEGKGKDKTAKIVMADGRPAPPHIDAAKIPATWKNLRVSADPDADVIATGEIRNKHGEISAKTIYTGDYQMRNTAIKFARTREGVSKIGEISDQIQRDRADPKKVENADVAWLMKEQGTRPGSESDAKNTKKYFGHKLSAENIEIGEPDKGGKQNVAIRIPGEEKPIPVKDKKTKAELIRRVAAGEDLHDTKFWLKSHGATTLEGKHIVETPEGVRLQFVGKESVYHNHLVRDPKLAQMLLDRKKKAGEDGKIFNTNDSKAAKYVKSLDGGHFTPKDLRTIKGTMLAAEEIRKMEVPKDPEEYDQKVLEIGEKVCHVLGNDRDMALSTYIDPTLFSGWRVKAGA